MFVNEIIFVFDKQCLRLGARKKARPLSAAGLSVRIVGSLRSGRAEEVRSASIQRIDPPSVGAALSSIGDGLHTVIGRRLGDLSPVVPLPLFKSESERRSS